MAFAWNNTHLPLNLADDREQDREHYAGSKRSRHPRYNRALAADGRTLTTQPQPHFERTGTLGPPVLDVEQARLDYARAAKHAHLARPRTRSEGGRSDERTPAKG